MSSNFKNYTSCYPHFLVLTTVACRS